HVALCLPCRRILARGLLANADPPPRALPGSRVCVGPLAAHGQALAVSDTPVAADVHETLDVHGDLAPQVALDPLLAIDHLTDARGLVFGPFPHPAVQIHRRAREDAP